MFFTWAFCLCPQPQQEHFKHSSKCTLSFSLICTETSLRICLSVIRSVGPSAIISCLKWHFTRCLSSDLQGKNLNQTRNWNFFYTFSWIYLRFIDNQRYKFTSTTFKKILKSHSYLMNIVEGSSEWCYLLDTSIRSLKNQAKAYRRLWYCFLKR